MILFLADGALYHAKRHGRDQASLYTPDVVTKLSYEDVLGDDLLSAAEAINMLSLRRTEPHAITLSMSRAWQSTSPHGLAGTCSAAQSYGRRRSFTTSASWPFRKRC